MNLLPKKVKIKPIIITIILLVSIILLVVAKDIIKLKKENMKDLSKNTAQAMYTTIIGDKTLDITNAVLSIPNSPTISAGMIPIKFDGSYWTITSTDDNAWYDYNNGKPAYVMLNDGVYQSEIIQNMKNKKLAKDYNGIQMQDKELGTIYMWLPRYAYNESGEILYIKQSYNVAGSWTIPEIFMYEIDKMDFSLAGIWIEYNPLASSGEVTNKISNMLGEENLYGFVANTKPISMTSKEQNAIKQYAKNIFDVNANNNLIIDTSNINRTILKIINTNQIEPIKAKVAYKNEKVILELIYSKYDIKQVLTEKGKELIKTGANTYELENLDDVTYTYKIIDTENNVKEVKIGDIYIISDVETLNKFRDEVNVGNTFDEITVIQTANIDMSSVCSKDLGSWISIGSTGIYFAGTYNGNYNQINNLYINTEEYYSVGLFSKTSTTTVIQNLIIENPYIYNSYDQSHSRTGAFVGINYGTIKNCASVGGTIVGYQTTTATSYKATAVGGIAGYHQDGVMINCFNTSEISGTANTSNSNCQARVGGIVGQNNCASIINCYNIGNVIAEGYYVWNGGIIGTMYKGSINGEYPTVINCYNCGTISIISGTIKRVAGIVAGNGSSVNNPAGTISNSYCTTETSYSYYYYSGGFKTSTEGQVDSKLLKEYASKLGDAFVEDTNNINNGYPILVWQTEQH